MYLICGKRCYQAPQNNVSKMNKLKSVNDEMDTIEILYAKHASQEVSYAD